MFKSSQASLKIVFKNVEVQTRVTREINAGTRMGSLSSADCGTCRTRPSLSAGKRDSQTQCVVPFMFKPSQTNLRTKFTSVEVQTEITTKKRYSGSSSFSLCRLLHCQQCSYVTRYHGQLKKHRRTHTGERPHRCSHCSKAFAQKNNLDDHLRLHTGDRPYQCHLCPRDFAQRTNLVTHLRTHTGEKAFQCRFCPEVFKYRYQREMHERNGVQARPGGEDSDSALA